MASYSELHELFNDGPLLDRCEVAVIIAANTIQQELPATANHANRLVWAKSAFENGRNHAKAALKAVLASNNAATVANIKNATDAALQANVDAVVDVLAGAV